MTLRLAVLLQMQSTTQPDKVAAMKAAPIAKAVYVKLCLLTHIVEFRLSATEERR